MAHLKIPTGKKMKREKTHYLRLAVLFIVLTIIQSSCDTTDPKPSNDLLTLTLVDVSVTEAYIHVKVESPDPDSEVLLKRDGKEVLSFNAGIEDTIVTDTSLTKSTSYSYGANLVEQNKIVSGSNKITLTTLEPTSHDFSWEVIKLGDPSTSELWDVAIIDENNIWAVGETYLNDSTGHPDPHAYNAVHWDGAQWNPIRIYYRENSSEYLRPIRAVFPFTDEDIWFGNFTHWDGQKFDSLPLTIEFNSTINKIWGTSSENIYVVGDYGNIARYDGSSWQKIESGTEGNITSVWGIIDEENGDEYLYYTIPSENKLLRIKNSQTIENTGWDEEKTIADVWGTKNELLYGVGEGGVYRKLGNKWEMLEIGDKYYLVSIDGQDINDIIVCGISGAVSHYNGISWKDYPELQSPSLSLRRVAIKGNTVVMVGIDSLYAVIIIGKR